MSNQPLHVVLGAGPAGVSIITELAQQDVRVRHVSRGDIPEIDSRVETLKADVSSPQAAIAATEGADVIYNALHTPYHLQVELLPGITDAVIAATAHHNARLVALGTLYPYGKANGEAITEQTPWAATSRKGRMRAELDQRYLDAHDSGHIRVAIGRAADFFGPGVINSTLGGTFFPGVVTKSAVVGIGDITLPHSYSYIRDVARGLVTLGTNPVGDGRVWHLPTVPAVSTAEVHRIVEDITGEDLTVEALTELVPFGPFDEQFISEYTELFYQHEIPQNLVSTDFETTFGAEPTPLREALADTIAWYRATLSGSDHQ